MAKHVHIKIADRGWILEKCAKEISKNSINITYDTDVDHTAHIQYYINYSSRGRRVSPVEVAFFTHVEQNDVARRRFFEVAADVDHCVCMSDRYANELISNGIPEEKVSIIAPGVDLDLLRPKVRIGVVGRTYHTGRKGEALVAEVMDVPGIEWCFTGGGWPQQSSPVPEGGMPDFYNSLDYVLVPALYEGGPMSVLEGLACGVPVITSDVGWAFEYPHIPFENGNANSLRKVLEDVVAEREVLRSSVLARSWKAWADDHLELFGRLSGQNDDVKSPVVEKGESAVKATLLTHGMEHKTLGGPSVRVPRTASELVKIGTRAALLTDYKYNFPEGDIAHIFNIWPVDAAYQAIERAKAAQKSVVFSPIFLNLSNMRIAAEVIPKIFSESSSGKTIDTALMAIAQQVAHEPNLPIREPYEGYHDRVKACIDNADHIVFLSDYERQCIEYLGGSPKCATLVHNPVDVDRFANAKSELFADFYGVDDYILCVGRIEPRKNQLVLAHAARAINKKIVFIGHTQHPDYYDLVKRAAGENGLFIPRLDPSDPLLPSAFAGASVFCLPSWAEGAPLAALEAAATGVPLVLSDRSSEREYFGDYAEYINPADIHGMRDALVKASNQQGDLTRRQSLQEHVKKKFNWGSYARETADVYTQTEEFEKSKNEIFYEKKIISNKKDNIYFDLTTTFHSSGHPTGIARVEISILQSLIEKCGDRVVPIIWNSRTKNYVQLTHFQALFRPSLIELQKMEGEGLVLKLNEGHLSGGRIIVVGGSWIRNSEYIVALRALKKAVLANLTVLIHDLIQMKLEHFYPEGVGAEFEKNAKMIVKVADHFLIYSECTRKDLLPFLIDNGQFYKRISKFRLGDMGSLRSEIENCKYNNSISDLQNKFKNKKFIIFVSSIEIRKNHQLLVNVWRRIVEERGADCPHLIFVGRQLWRGEEVVNAISREDPLKKFVHVLSDVNDDDLDWFYRNCAFTVFPSLYEGWGLPVAESLSYGKLCITSANTSTREVAPTLTELLDPYDFKAWRDRISFYIDTPSALEKMEQKIRDEYREHSWDSAVEEILSATETAPVLDNPAVSVFPGHAISFASGAGAASALPLCGTGWATFEKAGCWTVGNSSEIFFRYPVKDNKLFVRLSARAFLKSDMASRPFTFKVNGVDISTVEVGSSCQDFDFEVELDVLKNRDDNTISIVPHEIFSPSQVSNSGDQRKIGLFVSSMAFFNELPAPRPLPVQILPPSPSKKVPELLEIDYKLQQARDLITLPSRYTGKRFFSRLLRFLGIDRILLRQQARQFRRAFSSIDLIIEYLKNERR